MSHFVEHAAWTLMAAFILSLAYEAYRVSFRAHVSEHDTPTAFARLAAGYYLPAALIIFLLLRGAPASRQAALPFVGAAILVSLLYYNPHILPKRRPGYLDWAETLLFTGLLMVAASMLAYDLLGWQVSPAAPS